MTNNNTNPTNTDNGNHKSRHLMANTLVSISARPPQLLTASAFLV